VSDKKGDAIKPSLPQNILRANRYNASYRLNFFE